MPSSVVKLSISKASEIFGKDRKTISSRIKKGLLSCEINEQGHKLIGFPDLIEAFGEPKNSSPPSAVGSSGEIPQDSPLNSSPFHEEKILLLEQQIKDLREDKEDLKGQRDELLGILKTQTHLLEDKREKSDSSTELVDTPSPESDPPVLVANESPKFLSVFLIVYGILITAVLAAFAWV